MRRFTGFFIYSQVTSIEGLWPPQHRRNHAEIDIWSLGVDGKEGGEGVNADIGSWLL